MHRLGPLGHDSLMFRFAVFYTLCLLYFSCENAKQAVFSVYILKIGPMTTIDYMIKCDTYPNNISNKKAISHLISTSRLSRIEMYRIENNICKTECKCGFIDISSTTRDTQGPRQRRPCGGSLWSLWGWWGSPRGP